jgi:hypothetical protein
MAESDPFTRLEQELADKAEAENRRAVFSEALAMGINVEAVARRAMTDYRARRKHLGSSVNVGLGMLTEADAVIVALKVAIAERLASSN